MKRIFLAAIAALALVSCTKSDKVVGNDSTSVVAPTADTSVAVDTSKTK